MRWLFKSHGHRVAGNSQESSQSIARPPAEPQTRGSEHAEAPKPQKPGNPSSFTRASKNLGNTVLTALSRATWSLSTPQSYSASLGGIVTASETPITHSHAAGGRQPGVYNTFEYLQKGFEANANKPIRSKELDPTPVIEKATGWIAKGLPRTSHNDGTRSFDLVKDGMRDGRGFVQLLDHLFANGKSRAAPRDAMAYRAALERASALKPGVVDRPYESWALLSHALSKATGGDLRVATKALEKLQKGLDPASLGLDSAKLAPAEQGAWRAAEILSRSAGGTDILVGLGVLERKEIYKTPEKKPKDFLEMRLTAKSKGLLYFLQAADHLDRESNATLSATSKEGHPRDAAIPPSTLLKDALAATHQGQATLAQSTLLGARMLCKQLNACETGEAKAHAENGDYLDTKHKTAVFAWRNGFRNYNELEKFEAHYSKGITWQVRAEKRWKFTKTKLDPRRLLFGMKRAPTYHLKDGCLGADAAKPGHKNMAYLKFEKLLLNEDEKGGLGALVILQREYDRKLRKIGDTERLARNLVRWAELDLLKYVPVGCEADLKLGKKAIAEAARGKLRELYGDAADAPSLKKITLQIDAEARNISRLSLSAERLNSMGKEAGICQDDSSSFHAKIAEAVVVGRNLRKPQDMTLEGMEEYLLNLVDHMPNRNSVKAYEGASAWFGTGLLTALTGTVPIVSIQPSASLTLDKSHFFEFATSFVGPEMRFGAERATSKSAGATLGLGFHSDGLARIGPNVSYEYSKSRTESEAATIRFSKDPNREPEQWQKPMKLFIKHLFEEARTQRSQGTHTPPREAFDRLADKFFGVEDAFFMLQNASRETAQSQIGVGASAAVGAGGPSLNGYGINVGGTTAVAEGESASHERGFLSAPGGPRKLLWCTDFTTQAARLSANITATTDSSQATKDLKVALPGAPLAGVAVNMLNKGLEIKPRFIHVNGKFDVNLCFIEFRLSGAQAYEQTVAMIKEDYDGWCKALGGKELLEKTLKRLKLNRNQNDSFYLYWNLTPKATSELDAQMAAAAQCGDPSKVLQESILRLLAEPKSWVKMALLGNISSAEETRVGAPKFLGATVQQAHGVSAKRETVQLFSNVFVNPKEYLDHLQGNYNAHWMREAQKVTRKPQRSAV